MKKFLIILIFLMLSGCILPKYYDREQTIMLKRPKGTTLKIDGYVSDTSDEIEVKRSFFDLKVVLSKDGFEDKEFKFKSHVTDDKWAKIHTKEVSAVHLLPPSNTISMTGGGIAMVIMGIGTIPEGLFIIALPLGGIGGFIAGVGTDIYNLFIGLPSTAIVNPWYEYDKKIDLSKEILIPTPEFKRACHNNRGNFIGNNECTPCLSNANVIATETECNRCSNREYQNGLCVLKGLF